MNFTLRILNEDFSVMAEPPTYNPGSPIHVEARVESSAGVSPRIYVDECYGTCAKHLNHSRRIYVIVNNHGCLHGGESGDIAIWRRPEDSALQFAIQAFMLAGEPEEKIYIHCLLTAWGQESLTSLGKKSCYYNKFVGEGMLHRKVAGPLTVRKEEAPWYEERCHTLKKLLLVGVAFVGSCLVGALFVGGLLALALALFRSYQSSKGQRLLRKRKEYPYHTELQTVVSALVPAEEIQKDQRESSIDYNLNTDASEKE
ncbi:zona pellucida sperm-binding protein 3-like [Eretmochelys imbricata]